VLSEAFAFGENLLITHDHRLKRLSDNPRFIIINNYKCGYASSNILRSEPVTEIRADDQLIFFYRDILLRSVSVFINWCVNDQQRASSENWLLENLARNLSDAGFENFSSLLERRQYTEAFDVFVKILPAMYHLNEHTMPQTHILDFHAIKRLDYFVELENCVEFNRITGIAFPLDYSNKSSVAVKQRLIQFLQDTPGARDILHGIYKPDIEFFETNGLVCEGVADLQNVLILPL
jgi:hypothetical protein